MAKGDTTKDEDILEEAKEAFADARDSESDNRIAALDDLKFARLGEQWTDAAIKLRGERRPRLTINKLPAFIRQVVNDARQNKPSIKVRPVDNDADIHTAQVVNGIVRNIETASNADIAYDTAADCAVTSSFGYFRIDVEYSHDDTFEKDLVFKPIANPFSVYGDSNSTGADTSDWNSAFVTEWIPCKEFKRKHPDADPSNWEDSGIGTMGPDWRTDDQVLQAEWWKREEVPRKILLVVTPDGHEQVIGEDVYEENKDFFDVIEAKVQGEREVRSYKVKHRLLTGADVLETTDWAGRYIPISAVYGEEVNVEGKRILRSLIRDAKDPQRMVNYWKTTATELVALAPRSPWIGPEEAFQGEDSERWETANTENWDFLSYKGNVAPQRIPFTGIPAGAIQEALSASDDMKAVIGLYDASLGAKSNETSGKAIIARERQGDVSTFHFIDNLSRGIKHGGRILIDLIPHVYSGERIVRILGPEGQVATAKLGQRPQQDVSASPPAGIPQKPGQMQPAPGQPVPWPPQAPKMADGTEGAFDLSVGKYDLVVDVGPSYTTRRAEAAEQMMELIKSFPQAAPVIGDLVAKSLDWPGAQEIAERLHKMLPPQLQTGPDGQPLPPQPTGEMLKLQQEGEAGKQKAMLDLLGKMMAEKLKSATAIEVARIGAKVDLATSLQDTLAQVFADAQMAAPGSPSAPGGPPLAQPTSGPPPPTPPMNGFPGPQ